MKIAILGRGSTLKEFPGHDKFDEVWGLNRLAQDRLLSNGAGEKYNLDRLFVMDDLKLRVPAFEGEEWADQLKSYKGRFITSEYYEEWPCEAYPLEEVCKSVAWPLGMAMYSTVDYMIAMAIYEKVDEIHLYGIDCTYKAVTDVVRMSICVWIGAAQGRGIKVVSPKDSAFYWWTHAGFIHENGLYGYVNRPHVEKLHSLRDK